MRGGRGTVGKAFPPILVPLWAAFSLVFSMPTTREGSSCPRDIESRNVLVIRYERAIQRVIFGETQAVDSRNRTEAVL
jgi:hypothetical protein